MWHYKQLQEQSTARFRSCVREALSRMLVADSGSLLTCSYGVLYPQHWLGSKACSASRLTLDGLLQVKTLGAEVMAHLREVAGPEALLGAYNAARAAVEAQRTTRRTRQKLEVRLSTVRWLPGRWCAPCAPVCKCHTGRWRTVAASHELARC